MHEKCGGHLARTRTEHGSRHGTRRGPTASGPVLAWRAAGAGLRRCTLRRAVCCRCSRFSASLARRTCFSRGPAARALLVELCCGVSFHYFPLAPPPALRPKNELETGEASGLALGPAIAYQGNGTAAVSRFLSRARNPAEMLTSLTVQDLICYSHFSLIYSCPLSHSLLRSALLRCVPEGQL